MKKTLILLLISTSLFTLVSCGSTKKDVGSNTTTQNQTVETNDKNDTSKKEDTTDKEESKDKEEVKEEKNEQTTITVYMPNDNADGLDEKPVKIEHLTAYSVVNALAEADVVPKGTRAIKFEIKNNIGYLDVSSKIYNLNSGSVGESLMLSAVRETFLKAFKIEKVKLTVDGSTYTGSHIDYSPNDYL